MANFLDLPREIRDAIYSSLLSAPNSPIYISARSINVAKPSPARIIGRVVSRGTSEFVQTALLLVSKQVSIEAAEHLYSRNTFIPASPLSHFVTWLRQLTNANRCMIRHLDFPQRIFMPLLVDNIEAWSDVCAFIQGSRGSPPMQLSTVTVHIPLEFELYEPSAALGLRKLLSNRQQFWWPAVKFLLGLLMAGKTSPEPPFTIKQLKLVLPTLENRDIPVYQLPLLRPLSGPDSVDLEDLEAIRVLRTPRRPEDEPGEADILQKMKESGMGGAFTKRAWKDWHSSEPQASREPVDFHVRWQPTKEAEVLILD